MFRYVQKHSHLLLFRVKREEPPAKPLPISLIVTATLMFLHPLGQGTSGKTVQDPANNLSTKDWLPCTYLTFFSIRWFGICRIRVTNYEECSISSFFLLILLCCTFEQASRGLIFFWSHCSYIEETDSANLLIMRLDVLDVSDCILLLIVGLWWRHPFAYIKVTHQVQ